MRAASPNPISAARPIGRSSPTVSSRATSRPTPAWSGRAPTGPRACWSRSRPPRASRPSAAPSSVDALPETDFTAKALIENLPAGQDIFYRIRFQDHVVADVTWASRRSDASAPRRATGARSRSLWSGDTGGQRLGHRRGARRHARLCGHAQSTPGFLHPLRRSHLRRLPDLAAAEAAERRSLEEHRHRGKVQGRRDARRIPRQLQIQPARPQHARVQRRRADVRAMGRPRGHQRLVSPATVRCARLCREEHAQAVGTWLPRLPRIHADARVARPKPGASTARSPMVRCSTCSCWTCARYRAPIARSRRTAERLSARPGADSPGSSAS